MNRYFVVVFLILVNVGRIAACDCESKGEFLTVAPNSKLVALVKVNKYLTYKNINEKQDPLSMQLEIIEIYKGKESRKTITVWGDEGHLCRPYLNRFDLGKYYLIAFDQAGVVANNESVTDYSISICGDYWLDVNLKKRNANGSISKNLNAMSLADIKRRLALK